MVVRCVRYVHVCVCGMCMYACVGGANTKSFEPLLCARHSAGPSESPCQEVRPTPFFR